MSSSGLPPMVAFSAGAVAGLLGSGLVRARSSSRNAQDTHAVCAAGAVRSLGRRRADAGP